MKTDSRTMQNRWDAFVVKFLSILATPTFEDDSFAVKTFRAIEEADVNSDEFKGAKNFLSSAAAIPLDALYGRLQSNKVIVNRAAVQKVSTGELIQALPQGGGLIVELNNLFNEGTLDMEWMPIFAMGDLRANRFGIISTITSLVTWATYGGNEPIKTSPYKQQTFDDLKPIRHGGGLSFDRREMRVNSEFFAMNAAITAMRFSSQEFKAVFAYIIIQACIAAANSAGQTTAFVSADLPKTLNNGCNDLIEREQGKGKSVTAQSVIHLYAHPRHRDTVEAAFTATIGDDGENIRVHWPVVRHYTYNLATTLGISGSKVALVLPGRENVWGDFDDLRFEDETNIKRNGIEIIGQEQYNGSCESSQFQIVTIA